MADFLGGGKLSKQTWDVDSLLQEAEKAISSAEHSRSSSELARLEAIHSNRMKLLSKGGGPTSSSSSSSTTTSSVKTTPSPSHDLHYDGGSEKKASKKLAEIDAFILGKLEALRSRDPSGTSDAKSSPNNYPALK